MQLEPNVVRPIKPEIHFSLLLRSRYPPKRRKSLAFLRSHFLSAPLLSYRDLPFTSLRANHLPGPIPVYRWHISSALRRIQVLKEIPCHSLHLLTILTDRPVPLGGYKKGYRATNTKAINMHVREVPLLNLFIFKLFYFLKEWLVSSIRSSQVPLQISSFILELLPMLRLTSITFELPLSTLERRKSIWEITQVCKFSTLVHLLFRHRFRLSLTNILHVCARYYQELVERCSIGQVLNPWNSPLLVVWLKIEWNRSCVALFKMGFTVFLYLQNTQLCLAK